MSTQVASTRQDRTGSPRALARLAAVVTLFGMLVAGLFGTATAAHADPSTSSVVPVAARSAIAPVPAVNRGPFWENADCYAAGNAEMKTGKYTGFECTGSTHSWVCHLHEKPANAPAKHPVHTLPLERELQQPAPKAAPATTPVTPSPTPRSSVAENVRRPAHS